MLALINGVFIIRIFPDMYQGYGCSTSLFYCDLFLCFPATLVLWGVDRCNDQSLITGKQEIMLRCSQEHCSVSFLRQKQREEELKSTNLV